MTDFRKYNDEEEDIQGLLDAIKQQGTPYSEEPDPLYWANFRVRVMDQIDAKPVGFFARVRTWFMESTMRTSLVGGTLAVLLFGGIYLGTQDGNDPTVATNYPSTPSGIQNTPTVAGGDTSVEASGSIGTQRNGTVTDPAPAPDMAQTTPNEVPQPAVDPDSSILNDVAATAPLILAENESSGPAASLEDLTEVELESLLASIEKMN